jgi:hypothetical protein
MLMQAGQNPNAIGKHNVEQRVRKARDERAPSLTVSQGTGERVLGDEMHDEVERSPKPTAETSLPRLVPGLNFVNLTIREATKNDRQAHRLRSRDERTSDHGRSSAGFDAASESRRSISARCSSVTATEADCATMLSQMA